MLDKPFHLIPRMLNTKIDGFIWQYDMCEDRRSRRVIFLSYCILNNNTKAMGLVTADSSARSSSFLKFLVEKNIGVVQMPCPEIYFGLIRTPATKEVYDTQGFRDHCDGIARRVARDAYLFMSNGINVSAIVGVEGSPSCGVRWTHEKSGDQPSEGRGIFIESLESAFKELGIKVKIIGFPGKDYYGAIEDVIEEVL